MRYSEEEIKSKLKKEFDSLDKNKGKFHSKTNAVVILAAKETEITGENKERLDEGFKLSRKLKTKPTFLFLGIKEHNQNAASYINSRNVKFELIENPNQANTKDQIVDLKNYLEKHSIRSIILVSHIYHIPRIKRYCKILISKINMTFWKIGKIEDYKRQVNEEIEKIIEYSKQGDLPLFV